MCFSYQAVCSASSSNETLFDNYNGTVYNGQYINAPYNGSEYNGDSYNGSEYNGEQMNFTSSQSNLGINWLGVLRLLTHQMSQVAEYDSLLCMSTDMSQVLMSMRREMDLQHDLLQVTIEFKPGIW